MGTQSNSQRDLETRAGMAPRKRHLALVLSFSILALAACTKDDTYLPALLADPMSSYEAEGIELVDAWEESEGRDIVMDAPTHAQAGRTYRIVDELDAESVLNDAVAFAESQGWRMQQDITVSTLFVGSKPLPPGDGRLSLALGPADPTQDPDGSRSLNVLLDFGSVRFDDTTTSLP